MDALVSLLVQALAGGAGGSVIGQLVRRVGLGGTGNWLVGAIGGLIGTWLAGMIPGLDGLVGSALPDPAAGLNIGTLAGQGVTGLVGGGLLTALVGFVKSSVAKG